MKSMMIGEHVPIIMRVLASAVSLAGHASNIIRRTLITDDLEIIDKGINDFQTRADRDSQKCIVGSLTRLFPGLRVIGEEGHLEMGDAQIFDTLDESVMATECPAVLAAAYMADLVVWVDPLDGTREFTEGYLEQATVLIGISVRGRPVAGVLAQPFQPPKPYTTLKGIKPTSVNCVTRIVWALHGVGVFGFEPHHHIGPYPYPIDRTEAIGSLPHSIIVSRSHMDPEKQSLIQKCKPTQVIRAGGCGYKVLMTLCNKAHIYIHPSSGTKRWDTCAPEAIVNACGGSLTDLQGNFYDYSATKDPVNHDGVVVVPVAGWLPQYLPFLR